MEAIATINVRIPKTLKDNGSQVLERDSVSPTELVRSVYRYMEKERRIPECLDVNAGEAESAYEKKRKLVRSLKNTVHIPEGFDAKSMRAARIEEKHGDLL